MLTLAQLRTKTLAKTQRQLRGFFQERIWAAIAFWKLNARDREIFDALAGRRGRTREPRASDYRVRYQSTRLLLGLLLRHWRAAQTSHPERRYFFITLIDNLGRTLDVAPQLNLKSLCAKVYKALRDAKRTPDGPLLHAIYALEAQAFNNYPEHGHGKMISFHAHAVAWTDDPSFDPAAWADAINASRAWHAEFDLPPADISPLMGEQELAWAVRYLSKVPADCKFLAPARVAEALRRQRADYEPRPWPVGDGNELVETTRGYRRDLALRLFEGLSQLRLVDLVHGVGDGAQLRTDWRRQLTTWHRARAHGGRILTKDSLRIGAWWARQRRAHGSRRLKPWQFLTGRAKPHWPNIAADD